MTLRRSPLHDRHEALGAKFAPFGGWEMPLEYAGGGVLKEHTAVREAVGVFDVSHLGKARVRGEGAVDFLNACLSNDLRRIGPGQAQYTLCCDPSGGVVDDLIAYVYSDDHVFLIPNAANTAEVVRRLADAAPASAKDSTSGPLGGPPDRIQGGITITNEHEDHAVLAVQGPSSTALLSSLGLPTEHDYMSFATATLDGVSLTVCRTGYTGEHGYELVVPASSAGLVWDAIFTSTVGPRAAGLAARDTLRTEMGYPLHGQDLSLEISPVQAGSGWAVGWSKPEFWGRDALLAEKSAGPRRRLWGIESLDRGIPRCHMSVLSGDTEIGEVTSGTFSPTRRIGIGLALLDSSVEVGAEVSVDIRGRRSTMRVVKPPFVKPSVR